ncbi:DUF4236 domain-containing protein [Kitasatospora sp. NPDC088779]|uniref:DUF4236 domain-containing protein n=1 Tax=Kitasatospora sp. NPDC088779 TaxID=3154964 RepID=UPI003442E606
MGVYLRTSLKAGPFRFNLSRSGIGVSAGVPGFRVGTGPRGNYVRIGARGVSYRSTAARPRQSGTPSPGAYSPATDAILAGSVAVQEIPTATVEELQGSNPSEFINQLQAAARRRSVWPWAAVAALLLSAPLALLPLLVLGPLVNWLYLRDRAAQRVVAFYDFEAIPAERFSSLVDAAEALRSCAKNWSITASGRVVTTTQHKMNSGASSIVRREPAAVRMTGPRHLVTNIAVPTFTCGKTSLYLLPDRVLICEGRTFADLPYAALSATAQNLQFIEPGSVPKDSQRVGTTWKYVNVKGGPDKRFKNNPQLPVMLYGRLGFTTPSGLNILWDCSRPTAAAQLARSVSSYAAPPQLQQ